ncbi:MAG: hypothetical protein J0M04_24655 [Verrucomicrobia bacterium]|nr:hypothetical protein [Verrucomicrobiota bacterium]
MIQTLAQTLGEVGFATTTALLGADDCSKLRELTGAPVFQVQTGFGGNPEYAVCIRSGARLVIAALEQRLRDLETEAKGLRMSMAYADGIKDGTINLNPTQP